MNYYDSKKYDQQKQKVNSLQTKNFFFFKIIQIKQFSQNYSKYSNFAKMSSTLNRDVLQIIYEYTSEYEQARQAMLDEIRQVHRQAVLQEIRQIERRQNFGWDGEKEIVWYLAGYCDMIVNCCPRCGYVMARGDCGPYYYREKWGHCDDCGAKQY